MTRRLPRIFIWLCIPLLLAAKSPSVQFTYDELSDFRADLKPLLDLIASGEGGYQSVNRGRAGDSPGDWPKQHLGKSITEMSIKEIRQHQGGKNPDCWYNGKKGRANLFAVGRYQLIPCTLQYATVAIEDLDVRILYTPEVQDTLGVFLILVKRPVIRDYLAGIHNDHKEAGQELAKEFASVPIQYSNGRCKRGQSYYCGDKAGNKAHIRLQDVDAVLKSVRKQIQQDGDLYALITGKKLKKREHVAKTRLPFWKRWFRKDSGLSDSPISELDTTLWDTLAWTGTPTQPIVIIEALPAEPAEIPSDIPVDATKQAAQPNRDREIIPPQPPPIESAPIPIIPPITPATPANSEEVSTEANDSDDIDDPRIVPIESDKVNNTRAE